MKTKRILSIALIAISTAIFTTACYKSNNNYNTGGNGGGPGNYEIRMSNSAFSPPSLTVVAGSTVTWMNNDNVMHAVTTADGSLNTGDIPPGSSFSININTIRTFNYYDAHNASMIGVLVVTGGGGGY